LAGVQRVAAKAAVVQRCQVHKIRNVIDHLPEEHRGDVRQKLRSAYGMREYADARRGLDLLLRELLELNPSAARSLEEGMKQTLTAPSWWMMLTLGLGGKQEIAAVEAPVCVVHLLGYFASPGFGQ